MGFVETHGYWGRSSEQPIESLHHYVNMDLDQLCAIKDEEGLYRLLVKFQWLRNFYFDNADNRTEKAEEQSENEDLVSENEEEEEGNDDSDLSEEL